MTREQIIKLVKYTMTYYGSPAGERKNPGSRLQAQAEHIADVIEEYHEAQARLSGMHHVRVAFMDEPRQ